MDYTTLANLKSYLKITDDSRNTELTALITTATALVDLELGYNLGEETVVLSTNGMGTKRVILPQKPQSVSKIEVKQSNGTWDEIDFDFVDGFIVYADECMEKGAKNVRVTCVRGFDAVPKDFERLFCSYCAQLLQKQDRDTEGQIQTKKLDGLSITYFAPGEFQNEENMIQFQKLIAHYKSFSFSIST